MLFCVATLAWPVVVAVPDLQARVTDQTATLSAAAKAELEARLADLERRKGSQLAVLIVPSTGEETIEQFGIRVVDQWRLGRKQVDDGVLLLVARDDRTLRIEVGYGLEGAIPDALAKRVIDEVIVPAFKAGRYEAGIRSGIEALIGLIEGEPLPAPSNADRGRPGKPLVEQALTTAMMFIVLGGGLLRSLLGRLPGAMVTGAVSFAGAWYVIGDGLIAAAVAVFVFLFTLLGIFTGTGRGGILTGGRGGGGFSGGGGGFGGSGASGRW